MTGRTGWPTHRASPAQQGHNYARTFLEPKMSTSALVTLISARNADNGTLRAMLCEAFKQDSRHLVTANNGEPVQSAINALPMGKTQIKGNQNKAVGEAIQAGMLALRAALPDGAGWIGAVRGSFSKASKADAAPYESAHVKACEAFDASINGAEAWADKAIISAEQKAIDKAEREAKKAEAEAAIVQAGIDARIASGEIVPAANVIKVESLGSLALVEALGAAIARDGISRNALEALALVLDPTDFALMGYVPAGEMVHS